MTLRRMNETHMDRTTPINKKRLDLLLSFESLESVECLGPWALPSIS